MFRQLASFILHVRMDHHLYTLDTCVGVPISSSVSLSEHNDWSYLSCDNCPSSWCWSAAIFLTKSFVSYFSVSSVECLSYININNKNISDLLNWNTLFFRTFKDILLYVSSCTAFSTPWWFNTPIVFCNFKFHPPFLLSWQKCWFRIIKEKKCIGNVCLILRLGFSQRWLNEPTDPLFHL